MKKLLVVSFNSCYPLYHGGALAQYFFLEGLKDQVEFIYCTIVSTDRDFENIEVLKNKLPLLKVYFLDTRTPKVKETLNQKISKLIYNWYRFLFPKESKTKDSVIDVDDFSDPYFATIDKPQNPYFVALLNEIILKEKIKQVQFEFYDTMSYCFAIPSTVRKIFIHHELRFKRLKLAYTNSSLPESYKNFLINKTETYERLCLQQMDEVVVFNQDDAGLLTADCNHLTVSPFGVPEELIFKERKKNILNRLLFVGGEGHNPNKLGLLWFLDTIYLPNITSISFPLYIIGEWSEEIKEKYNKYSQLIFCGEVESIEPFFESSVFVNPILTGSGLRTKVLHAFVNMVPVLSTRFGAEGCFDEKHNSHLCLFDNANEFLEKLQTTNFIDKGIKGFDFYNQFFNKEKLLDIRNGIIN